jgi:hypothetical protein
VYTKAHTRVSELASGERRENDFCAALSSSPGLGGEGKFAMGIVWISSYPKSGNTWMRFLLANYLAGPIQDSTRIEELIPGVGSDIDVAQFVRQRGTVYAKSHYVWDDRHPHRALTDRAIVVVRHPKDVLLSNLNYRHLAGGNDKAFTDKGYARAFIHYGGDPRWITEGFGTFEQSIASWLDGMSESQRLVVRYEDLHLDSKRELARVLEFLRVPVDEDRIGLAARASTFDQMRAMEVRERRERQGSLIFPGAAPRRGWARFFMNSGTTGGSLRNIAAGLDEAFDKAFASVMDRLGYSVSTAH